MTTKIIGLISRSSLEYVQHAFAALNKGETFVNIQTLEEGTTRQGLIIDEVIEPGSSHGWYTGEAYFPSSDSSVAQISYTSGTEGKPKGVMISHAALANTTQRLLDIMEIDSSIREYIGVPVNYSFGFGRCRTVSAAGGQFFLPEHGFNPLEISQMLATDEINAISAVPSLWRLVLETPEIFQGVADKVRWIEIGSQYMSADEKRELRELFSQARIIQHYGLTEASRSTFLDIQSVDVESLESVGKGYYGVETAIGEGGRIKIRGPHLATWLLIDGEKLPLTDNEGWLITNDAGHVDGGFLYFDGRLDDLINLGGTKLSPENVEAALRERLNLENGLLAIFRTSDATQGDRINVAILQDAGIDEGNLRLALQQILGEYGLRVSSNFPVHQINQFPLTNTGKLKRSELSRRFAAHETEQLLEGSQQTKKDRSDSTSAALLELIGIWEDVLKISPISPQDNFFDIGGDSLSAIRVTLRMEKAGIPKTVCRKIFEGYSIENLVAELAPKAEENSQNPSHSPGNDQTRQMIAIWQDVLKIDSISVDDGFFDLGGDSLSAIRVVTRMEKAGIPKEVCRKIFEGHSIKNILNLSANDDAEPQTAQKRSTQAEDLIAIWQDVLKIDNVSEDDSFFDLGGDSLSAIRVVVRMEAAGIPKETCRKIFEGHSIRDIVGSNDVVPENSSTPTQHQNVKSAELIAIWQDVLKVDNVTEDDSFFDLGGDSLSAIRVVVRMEAAGIPKETCRKIFEGHSIQNIVSTQISHAPDKNSFADNEPAPQNIDIANPTLSAVEPLKRTRISSANLSLNVVRGFLVLMNIAAHWMPGIVARLPAFAAQLNTYFAPLYSSGTPGFAMVFGAGLSFFVLPRFNKSKASVNKLCKRNALLLGTGMSCLAAVVIAVSYFSGADIAPTDVSNAFYSVLFYYFFAVISIPIWLRLLTWRGSYTLSCVTLACIFYACHLAIDAMNIPPSENPLIQTGILILTPKYNYLEMSAAVMLGAAAGSWIKETIESGKSIYPLFITGILLVAFSIIISFETGEYEQWFVWPKGLYLWTWPFYLGCILVSFYYLFRYIEKHDIDAHPVIGFVLRAVSVIGVMAFPLFIGHELVRPLAELLGIFSIPGSLIIAMILFFGYSWYLLKKLYGLYYASN